MVDETNFISNLKENTKNETFETKYIYTSIVRSQLSDYELLWIFYNCLSLKGAKFKPLIEKYSLLKNLPIKEIHNSLILKMYDKKAYGKSFEFPPEPPEQRSLS